MTLVLLRASARRIPFGVITKPRFSGRGVARQRPPDGHCSCGVIITLRPHDLSGLPLPLCLVLSSPTRAMTPEDPTKRAHAICGEEEPPREIQTRAATGFTANPGCLTRPFPVENRGVGNCCVCTNVLIRRLFAAVRFPEKVIHILWKTLCETGSFTHFPPGFPQIGL